MKAIVVREFGEPDVMKLEETRPIRSPDRATCSCASARPASIRSTPTCTPAPTRASRAALHAGLRRRRRSRSGRRRRQGFAPGDRVYIAAPAIRAARRPAPTRSARSARRRMLHRLPARASFAQGAAIGVPYATAYRALFQRASAQARRNGARARRDRRRRHRRRRAGARARPDGDRHRRDRRGPRSGRANTAPTSSSTTASRITPTRSCARPAAAAST